MVHQSPTHSQWLEASSFLAKIERLIHQLYGDKPVPQGLIISADIKKRILDHTRERAPVWADELWG